MTDNEMEVLVIGGIVVLLFVVIAIILMCGKGKYLISGYNTAKDKEKYDVKLLGKFLGKIVLVIAILFFLDVLGILYEIPGSSALCMFGVVVVVIFAVIYCNTKGRFKK